MSASALSKIRLDEDVDAGAVAPQLRAKDQIIQLTHAHCELSVLCADSLEQRVLGLGALI